MGVELAAKDLASRLGKARVSGKGWQCCCPAHDDKKPSLVIYDRPSGRPYVQCLSGCDFKDVRAALISQGLWSDERSAMRASSAPRRLKRSSAISPVPSDMGEPDYQALLDWTPTTVYRYGDAENHLLHLIARIDHPDGSKDIRPIIFVCNTDGTTGWKARAPNEPRPLYGLDLLAKRPNDPVLVVEGEKTADAARELFGDHVVVTWSGGANAVAKADWSPLRERDVVLWPDNDDAGKKAMQLVAAALQEKR